MLFVVAGVGLELLVSADIVSDTCIASQWIVLADNSGGTCGFSVILDRAQTTSNLSVLLSNVVANNTGEQAAA